MEYENFDFNCYLCHIKLKRGLIGTKGRVYVCMEFMTCLYGILLLVIYYYSLSCPQRQRIFFYGLSFSSEDLRQLDL